MTPKRTVVISFSPTRTTSAVLAAIAKGIAIPVTTFDMTNATWREHPVPLNEDDLLLIGFPVYGGRLPRIQEQIFSLLERGKNPVVPVVVYGNRAYEDALLELATLCRGKGYKPVAAGAFIGEHSYSSDLGAQRPDSKDKDLAVNFGKRLIKNLQENKFLGKKDIPGNTPFKDLPPKLDTAPTTTNACSQCKHCVDICPMQAISADNPHEIAIDQCILCAACVKGCPEQAKEITFLPLLYRMKDIIETNMHPKEPELFLPA